MKIEEIWSLLPAELTMNVTPARQVYHFGELQCQICVSQSGFEDFDELVIKLSGETLLTQWLTFGQIFQGDDDPSRYLDCLLDSWAEWHPRDFTDEDRNRIQAEELPHAIAHSGKGRFGFSQSMLWQVTDRDGARQNDYYYNFFYAPLGPITVEQMRRIASAPSAERLSKHILGDETIIALLSRYPNEYVLPDVPFLFEHLMWEQGIEQTPL